MSLYRAALRHKGHAHHSRLSLRHGRAIDNDILSGRGTTHRAQPLCKTASRPTTSNNNTLNAISVAVPTVSFLSWTLETQCDILSLGMQL
jgi:hypothetical protein